MTAALAPVANAMSFTDIFVLGDSLSDTGNVFAVLGTPADPYFDGNFSNGPVWIEIIAAALNLPVNPNFQGGTNYAIGGAQTSTAGLLPGSGLTSQGTNLISFSGGTLPSDALYAIWGGGNDVLNSTSLTGPGNLSQEGADNIAAIVTNLAAAGATTFLIPNLPDIGATPAAGSNSALFSQLTDEFNTELAQVIADLQANLGVTIITLDVFSILDAFLSNPMGLNTTDPCFVDAGNVCADPDNYVFWDDVHPTAFAHAVLGNTALASLVPVPAAVWLFGSALIGLFGLRRRPA